MGQMEIREQLLKLHNVITRSSVTYEDIVKNRKLDPGISLTHNTELSGLVALGSRVSVEKYGTLGDKLDYGTSGNAQ